MAHRVIWLRCGIWSLSGHSGHRSSRTAIDPNRAFGSASLPKKPRTMPGLLGLGPPTPIYLTKFSREIPSYRNVSIACHSLGGAQRKRLNGERGRLAAAGGRKHAGIGDPQIAPAMASSEAIDHRACGIIAHAAGAEDMSCDEPVPARIVLIDPFRAACREQLLRLAGHETKARDVGLGKDGSDARQRHTEAIARFRIEIDPAIAIWQPFANRPDVQPVAPETTHRLRMGAAPARNRP